MRSDQAIWDALQRVVDPCSIATGVPISLVDMGIVKTVSFDDGAVHVLLRLTSPVCWQAANILAKVEEVVGAEPEVTSVTCEIDPLSDWMPDMIRPDIRQRLRAVRPLANQEATKHN